MRGVAVALGGGQVRFGVRRGCEHGQPFVNRSGVSVSVANRDVFLRCGSMSILRALQRLRGAPARERYRLDRWCYPARQFRLARAQLGGTVTSKPAAQRRG